jgi:hypothetical protein
MYSKLLTSLLSLGLVLGLAACSSSQSDGSGGSGGGGTGGSPSVILDGGGDLPDAPNGASACMSGVCNYQTQDCAGGQSCLPSDNPPATGDWPPQCFSAGSKQAGESCSSWNDCVKGYFCLGISGAADGGVVPGTCRKLCCGGDWSACDKGEACFQQVYLMRPSGGAAVYAKADVCAPTGNCDPLAPTSCPTQGETCQIVDPIGDVACVPEGKAGLGATCSDGSEGAPITTPCKGGLTCVAGECRRLCRAVEGGGTPACSASEGVCVHFNRDPAGVGECTPKG